MGKIIDIFTGKEIPPEPSLTLTQTLTKSIDLVDRSGIDFEDQDNNEWEEILQKNNMLSPAIIIGQFQGVLAALLKGETIDKDYCTYMYEQCKNWEESDKFVIAE